MAAGPLGSSILREWDEAPKARRKELLQWLQERLRDAQNGGFSLERTCGADVSLLLPRILAWIDQTNNPPKTTSRIASQEHVVATDEQLECLRLFLTSLTTAHVHMREFIHAGGLRVLLETLQHPPDRLSTAQRCVIYRILLPLIRRGRSYKAQVSQLDGEIVFVRGAIASVVVTSETATPSSHLQSEVWTLCRTALLEQMVGNTEYVETTHHAILFMLRHTMYMVRVFGAQILREMISATSFFYDAQYCAHKQTELVPHCVQLLQSLQLPLQHEGLELVHTLLHQPPTRRQICSLLGSWIHEAALAPDHLDAGYASMQRTREYEVYSHLRSPFVHATQALTTLLNSKPRLLPLLVAKHEILVPMAFVLTVERPQSLKWLAALTAIHFIFTRCTEVACSHLSELFLLPMDRLTELPAHLSSDELAQELVGDDAHRQLVVLHFHRNGWIRPMGPPPFQADPEHTTSASEDTRLDVIAYTMDAAVNSVLPSCLLESSPAMEDEDVLTDDDVDFAAQQKLQQKLEVHFRRFREFPGPVHAANYPTR